MHENISYAYAKTRLSIYISQVSKSWSLLLNTYFKILSHFFLWPANLLYFIKIWMVKCHYGKILITVTAARKATKSTTQIIQQLPSGTMKLPVAIE